MVHERADWEKQQYRKAFAGYTVKKLAVKPSCVSSRKSHQSGESFIYRQSLSIQWS